VRSRGKKGNRLGTGGREGTVTSRRKISGIGVEQREDIEYVRSRAVLRI
jgi:hypothetical protein